tara:strand:- start:3339 stop:3767 length:429 start_codon:yes stop_codon:yes gene_type:complete
MEYQVGEILWIVSREGPGITVVRIVEELIKKTLDGTKTSYIAESFQSRKKSFELSKVKGKIYKSSGEAKQHMINQATNAIELMVKKCESAIPQQWNIEEKPSQIIKEEQPANISESDDYEFIELENGQKARIRKNEILENLA